MASGDGNSVSAAWAHVVAGELRKAGVDLESALREAGLEARTINNEEAWIPFTRHAALMEIAARELKHDCYGAKLDARTDPRKADALSYMGAACRTLARRLSDLDTSFADIVDRLRHELALRYLNEPNLSLTQVSFLLGYAGPSAFTHACRRRTGKTPREIQRG